MAGKHDKANANLRAAGTLRTRVQGDTSTTAALTGSARNLTHARTRRHRPGYAAFLLEQRNLTHALIEKYRGTLERAMNDD